MSRLINAERLVSDIQEKLGDYGMSNDAVYRDVRDIINEQPTAYDADKVVEDLKDYAIEFECFGTCNEYVEIGHAIEIVKAGVSK